VGNLPNLFWLSSIRFARNLVNGTIRSSSGDKSFRPPVRLRLQMTIRTDAWSNLLGVSLLALTSALFPYAKRSSENNRREVAASGATALATTGGVSFDDEADARRKIDTLFERYAKNDGPGCAVGVMREGNLLFSNSYGLANVENVKPLDHFSSFNIGSMSKQFTALSILLLEQQQKLSLSDDITKYLPEMPHYQRPITIRNLLEHSSGLRDQDELMKLAGFHTYEDLLTNRDYLTSITRQKELNFLPGSEAVYSDTGYTLLGQIVERVSGMTLGRFEKLNIFQPLGMEHTLIRDDHSMVIPNSADGYIKNRDGSLHKGVTNDESTGPGNVITTIEDYAKWDRNFYTQQVGGAAAIAAMQTPGHLADKRVSRYALGLQIGTDQGYSTVEHGGADAGYHSFYVRYPEAKLSAVVLCNIRDYGGPSPSQLAKSAAGAFLIAKPTETALAESGGPRTSPALADDNLGDYAGPYFRAEDGSVIVFKIEGKSLSEIDDVTDMKSSVPLFSMGQGRFRNSENIETTFRRKSGSIIAVQTGGTEKTTFTKMPPAGTSPAALAQLAGDYNSDELGSSWKIVVSDHKVILRRARFPDEVLLPVFRDGFYGEQWTLVFLRDKSHNVIAVTATNERIRAFSFRKKL
jgi:CubicO group peptidase (beta-lactamase class C family)